MAFLLVDMGHKIWSALDAADAGSAHRMIFHIASQLALAGCKREPRCRSSWVFQSSTSHGWPLRLMADAPVAIENVQHNFFIQDRQGFDSLPHDPGQPRSVSSFINWVPLN